MISNMTKIFNRQLLKIFLLSLSILYSFICIFWGLDISDSFYYLMIFKSNEPHWMIGAFQIGGLIWIKLFGDTLVSMRICNWLLYSLSIICAYVWFIPKENQKQLLSLLSIPFLLLPTFSLNILNPDSFSLFLLVCYCKSFKDWFNCNNISDDILLVTLMLLLVAVRFPNITLIPVSLVLVIACSTNRKYWMKFSIDCVVFMLLYIFWIYLLQHVIYTANDKYLLLFGGENDGSHGIISLISCYWSDAKMMIQYIPICLIVFIMYSRIYKNKCFCIISIFLATFFLLCYMWYFVKLNHACHIVSLFASSVCISLLLIKIFKSLNYDDYVCVGGGKEKLLPYLIVFSVAWCMPAGSDTGLLKLFPAYMVFIPFILYDYKIIYYKKPLLFLIIMLVAICVRIHYLKPFGDLCINKLNYVINNRKLKGIRTSIDNYKMFESINDEIINVTGENVVFYSCASYAFYECFEKRKILSTSFFMLDDSKYDIESLSQCMKKYKPTIFFMPYSERASKRIFETRDSVSEAEKMILGNGYEEIKQTDYYVLYKSQDR